MTNPLRSRHRNSGVYPLSLSWAYILKIVFPSFACFFLESCRHPVVLHFVIFDVLCSWSFVAAVGLPRESLLGASDIGRTALNGNGPHLPITWILALGCPSYDPGGTISRHRQRWAPSRPPA